MEQSENSGESKTKLLGWFWVYRHPDALELIRAYPLAYVLASVIARRAWWSHGYNADGLGIGEAMLGDHDMYGMSEREYRTAKEKLKKGNFATFRKTNRGTIGRLIDTRLFSIRSDIGDEVNVNQPTSSRRASDKQPTTNEERVEGEKDNNEKRLNDATESNHRQTASKEKELMGRLRGLLGEGEMKRAGGNWRENWVRKRPALVERGLNELELQIKEGKQIHNSAAYLVDLLKRWLNPKA